MRLFGAIGVAFLAVQAAALSIGGKNMKVERDSDGLQNIVSSIISLPYNTAYN